MICRECTLSRPGPGPVCAECLGHIREAREERARELERLWPHPQELVYGRWPK